MLFFYFLVVCHVCISLVDDMFIQGVCLYKNLVIIYYNISSDKRRKYNKNKHANFTFKKNKLDLDFYNLVNYKYDKTFNKK